MPSSGLAGHSNRSMDSFVINTLREWQLTDLVNKFKEDYSKPLSQIETYMENTSVYRAKWIRDNNWTIDQILEEFPHLMTKGMVDGVGDLALRQLPALLPPTTYKVGHGRGVKVVRHTIQECRLAFIDHKPPGINMVEFLHEAKACRPYPHILTLGTDQSAFQVFVIIAGKALEQVALLQAIDVCFKAFFVFDIKYPKQCEHVWEFIQTEIYEMPGGESKLLVVGDLEANLTQCRWLAESEPRDFQVPTEPGLSHWLTNAVDAEGGRAGATWGLAKEAAEEGWAGPGGTWKHWAGPAGK
ncbi:hypothetical protein E1301_Tti020365 [Triplophysa tibetana]|uniref:Uncharacterized protein n=1 Tax=Triplophysa tibetana TaxID=1572043 RepID=A0A5A9P673_9TELE|nr:hypothetical protein E1301_Tti020365 [Triplophysa tibetana]